MPFCCQGRLQVHRYHQKHERHGQHHLLRGFKHKLQSTAGPGPGRTVPKPKPSKTTTTPHFREETSTTNLGRWHVVAGIFPTTKNTKKEHNSGSQPPSEEHYASVVDPYLGWNHYLSFTMDWWDGVDALDNCFQTPCILHGFSHGHESRVVLLFLMCLGPALRYNRLSTWSLYALFANPGPMISHDLGFTNSHILHQRCMMLPFAKPAACSLLAPGNACNRGWRFCRGIFTMFRGDWFVGPLR